MLSWRTIIAGMIGALLGFGVTMLVLGAIGFGNPMDPIMSGLIALVFVCPLGAIAGLVLGVKLAMRMQGQDNAAFMRNVLAALGATLLLSAGIGGAAVYEYNAGATPWLNPNAPNVMLQFEVRLPVGAVLPASAKDVDIELQTALNRMPAEVRQLRSEDGRPVIAGEVDLAFRTDRRQLAVKIPGQGERVFFLGLADKPPHTRELGAWERRFDGSEIRYRVKWPGQDN